MKQKTKGVISVFLLIIFLPMYMATGMMVDYGRIKMAQATVSMSAAQATESVLSYYNELLYEMYGLFALDSRNTDKIQEIFENYLKKTLLVGNVSEEQISGVVDAFNNTLNDVEIFDGYKFNIDEVNVGSTFNLSQRDVTRVQILEYMKYRAPYEMVTADDGFISKVSSMLKLGDIIDANIEVRKEFDYKGFVEEQQNAIVEYKDFVSKLNEKYDDNTINDIENLVNSADSKIYFSYDEENELEQECISANNDTIDDMVSDIEKHTYAELDAIDNVISKIESVINSSNSNINAIENLINTEESQEKILVYQNMIYLIKNSCGELIRYSFELKWLKGHFENQKTAIDGIEDFAYNLLSEESNIEDEILNSYYFKDLTKSIDEILEIQDYLLNDTHEAENINYEGKIEKAKKVNKSYGDELKNYVDIEGAVTEDEEVGSGNTSDLLSNSDNIGNTDLDYLNFGKMFIDNISSVLASKADGIFVDEYIMEHFANVVHHMKAENKDDSWPAGFEEDLPTTISTFDENKIFNKSEVEYILTGNQNSKQSVMQVGTWILSLRIALNTAAIFTDNVKVMQATEVAGVYAPLLLIAWAVAESTVDLVNIQNGYKVYVFKQGSDWVFSTSGVLEKLVDYGVDKATDKAMEEVTTITSKVSGYINTGIYDAFYKIDDGLGGISENLEKLGSIKELAEYTEPVKKGVDDLSNIKDELSSEIIFKVSQLENLANEKAESFVSNRAGQLGDDLKGRINDVVPVEMGELEQVSSSLKIEFGYGDYLRLFLLLQDENTKLGNMQKIIQTNIALQQTGFTMNSSITNVFSEIKVSMKYLFMTKAFVKQPGVEGNRHQLRVITNKAY